MRKLAIAFVALAFLTGLALAQEKTGKKKATEKKISGEIVAIDEAKSTILIKKANDMYTVAFNASTKWTHQVGKKIVRAKRSDFKQGVEVICLATADEHGKWVAKRIDLTPEH